MSMLNFVARTMYQSEPYVIKYQLIFCLCYSTPQGWCTVISMQEFVTAHTNSVKVNGFRGHISHSIPTCRVTVSQNSLRWSFAVLDSVKLHSASLVYNLEVINSQYFTWANLVTVIFILMDAADWSSKQWACWIFWQELCTSECHITFCKALSLLIVFFFFLFSVCNFNTIPCLKHEVTFRI